MWNNHKIVYDLNLIKENFGEIQNMPILEGKSFSFSKREAETFGKDSVVEFYDRNHKFLGQDANTIGPYGLSDYWDYDEDGNVFSTDTPEVDFDVFEDHIYNVIVVRS